MIEIIPNWHPFFVHFTIALLMVATLFHIIAALNTKSTNYYQFENVANWNLWLGVFFAVITVVAGWFASNSVDHDTPSHLAMMEHRNWALGTAGLFILLAFWSFRRARKALPITWLITLPLVVASLSLGATGWLGGELVYRHGLGVMSLPDTNEHDHGAHDHGSHDHGTDEVKDMLQEDKGVEGEHEVGEKAHSHDNEHDDKHQHDSIDEEPNTTGDNSEVKQNHNNHTHDHSDHPH